MEKQPKNNGFINSILEIKEQSKNVINTTKNMTTEFTKLPWKKLPAIGWFYIIFLALIMFIVGAFIVPYLKL